MQVSRSTPPGPRSSWSGAREVSWIGHTGEWRSGSAPALGAGGRGFKSRLPDGRADVQRRGTARTAALRAVPRLTAALRAGPRLTAALRAVPRLTAASRLPVAAPPSAGWLWPASPPPTGRLWSQRRRPVMRGTAALAAAVRSVISTRRAADRRPHRARGYREAATLGRVSCRHPGARQPFTSSASCRR